MSGGTRRKLAILEPMVVFGLILAYIWSLRYHYPAAWAPILALPLVSHWCRGEGVGAIGFRVQNLAECLRRFAPALAFLALTLLAAGLLLDTVRRVPLDRAALTWAIYLPWGLFQQYLLNGYCLKRLEIVLPGRGAAVAAAALFSAVHAPNWFLMPVTLLAGYVAARLYSSYRNLYFLGLAHGTLGVLLFLVVPDSISHHLVVGPGWFAH
ncbi:MAG: CPBP family glutamic-type intramembrane protease [Bryobacteraceae bacterium]